MIERARIVRLIHELMAEARDYAKRVDALANVGVFIPNGSDYIEIIADAFDVRPESLPDLAKDWNEKKHFSRDWLYDSFGAGDADAFLTEIERSANNG